MEWQLELNLSTKTILTRGSEFLMDWTSWSQTWSTRSTTTTSRRPLRRRRKHLRWNRMYLRLQADQRLKQNQEDLPLLAHLQELYLFVREYGLILNQELNSIKRTQWQKGWTLFFGMDNYLEKKMVQSNSGDWKMTFGKKLSTLNIGLMKCGRARWQEAEATRKDFNIALTRQDKKCFISELFKVIQYAIPLILLFRTMCWFRTISSSTFIILDVQSIYIPSQIQDWHREDKIGAGKRQTVFLLLVNPNGQGSQRSSWSWLDHTTSCMVQAEKVEKTSRHGILGRYTACSTKRIEVLSNKM